jgi:AcrR family transcriptional regulator
MVTFEGTRPGGRSARIQQSVHDATRELLAVAGREEVTVQLIALRAGVNPTTIYRRWGDLAALLSDVATERFRQVEPPAHTGSLEGDLALWAEQLAEEMSSGPGRSFAADVIAGDGDGRNAGACARHSAETVAGILDRHPEDSGPDVDEVIDHVVAPIMYRILFARDRSLDGFATDLVRKVFEVA